MDFRTLGAIILMVAIFFLTYPPSKPPQRDAATPQVTTQPINTSKLDGKVVKLETTKNQAPAAEALLKLKTELKTLSNEVLELKINSLGEVLNVQFLKYSKEPNSEEKVSRSFSEANNFNLSSVFVESEEVQWKSAILTDETLELLGQTGSFQIIRRMSLESGTYFLRVVDQIKNEGASSADAKVKVRLAEGIDPTKQSSFLERIFKPQANFQKAVWLQKDSLDYKMFEEVASHKLESPETFQWAGFADKYFLYAFVPLNTSLVDVELTKVALKIEERFTTSTKQIPPGDTASLEYAFYLGPKKISDLEKLTPSLTRSIEYGNWIGPISRVLLSILLFFESLFKNFGVAIILLTVVVKTLLFPLAYKAAVSMRKLSLLQPKMLEVREKYKKDPQRMNVEMMSLYKTEKVNPVGGCLPMLVQMPVFFALYRVFFASIEMRHSPFIAWIQDLAHYDHFFVLPVAMTALMVYQQRITPMPDSGQDSEAMRIQKVMLKWMPPFFGAIMLFLPAGLTLYFLVNSALSIAQQLFINKKLDKILPRPASNSLQVVNGN